MCYKYFVAVWDFHYFAFWLMYLTASLGSAVRILQFIICIWTICKYVYTQMCENLLIPRSRRPEVFCKNGVLRNFAKFTGKHLCQSLFFNKVAGDVAVSRCSCWEKGNFILVSEFRYGQTWQFWPSPLSSSIYSTFKEQFSHKTPIERLPLYKRGIFPEKYQ